MRAAYRKIAVPKQKYERRHEPYGQQQRKLKFVTGRCTNCRLLLRQLSYERHIRWEESATKESKVDHLLTQVAKMREQVDKKKLSSSSSSTSDASTSDKKLNLANAEGAQTNFEKANSKEEEEEEAPKCPVCLEHFKTNCSVKDVVQPVAMSCGHTVCMDCLVDIFEHEGDISEQKDNNSQSDEEKDDEEEEQEEDQQQNKQAVVSSCCPLCRAKIESAIPLFL